MEDNLIALLESFKLPVIRQGSLAPDEAYPDTFFTFWNYDTPEGGFYDNEANRAVWVWYIYAYTSDPALLYSNLDGLIKILKEKGFAVEGRGRDIASGIEDYVGRYVVVRYIENYSEKEN